MAKIYFSENAFLIFSKYGNDHKIIAVVPFETTIKLRPKQMKELCAMAKEVKKSLGTFQKIVNKQYKTVHHKRHQQGQHAQCREQAKQIEEEVCPPSRTLSSCTHNYAPIGKDHHLEHSKDTLYQRTE